MNSTLRQIADSAQPGQTPPPSPALGFSTAAISNVSGATERQLQWWDEHGLVKPMHTKKRRAYTLSQGVLCLIIQRLRTQGYSLQHIRKLTCGLTVRGGANFHRAIEEESELFLLVGKKTTRFATSEHTAMRDMILQNQAFSPIAVHELARALKDCADPMAKGERR